MIEILLATYNGAAYLSSQIDSIFAQSSRDWRLLIHDDGSTDETLDIIEQYVQKDPERIVLLKDNLVNLGAKHNFGHLMAQSSAEYIMFCDQDDVWLPDKIEDSFSALKLVEEKAGSELPIGIFTDVRIVDSELNELSSSAWKYQNNTPPSSITLKGLSVRNCVTGCTMIVNRPAVNAAIPIPNAAIMHDWWIALSILKAGGHLSALPKTTLLYRQHDQNAIGARAATMFYYIRRLGGIGKLIMDNRAVYIMAKAIGSVNNPAQFIGLKARTWLNRHV